MNNADMPAFPAWELNGSNNPEMTCFGLTKREAFTATILAGLVYPDENIEVTRVVTLSIQLADEALHQL